MADQTFVINVRRLGTGRKILGRDVIELMIGRSVPIELDLRGSARVLDCLARHTRVHHIRRPTSRSLAMTHFRPK